MKIPPFFISCDWGTSNFRLRVVNTETLEVLQEIQKNDGVKKLNQSLEKSNRLEHFSDFLLTQISGLAQEHRKHPFIISGMASSTIGMKELPYALMPFSAKGEGVKYEYIKAPNGLSFILISGVKSEASVMRGEEIQAIGLSNQFGGEEKGLLILPGTHSKHLTYENGAYTAMKTYMTGELFQLLSEHSILAGSVLQSEWNEEAKVAFLEGVSLGKEKKMSQYLFSVRVKDITKTASKEENYFFLSGLLIGDELSDLKEEHHKTILAASGPVYKLYKLALNEIMDNGSTVFCDSTIIQNALLEGHKKILIQHVKTK